MRVAMRSPRLAIVYFYVDDGHHSLARGLSSYRAFDHGLLMKVLCASVRRVSEHSKSPRAIGSLCYDYSFEVAFQLFHCLTLVEFGIGRIEGWLCLREILPGASIILLGKCQLSSGQINIC